MITIEQCRAARGLLDWTQQDLAEASGLSKTAINNFEKGHSDIKTESLRAIRMAFESADIEFMEHGLRKKSDTTRVLKGSNALGDLLDDIYETLKASGGEVLLLNGDENLKARLLVARVAEHVSRFSAYNISMRILSADDISSLFYPIDVNARLLEKDNTRARITRFMYGSRIALDIGNGTVMLILNSAEAASSEKRQFNLLWNQSRQASSVPDAKKAGLF